MPEGCGREEHHLHLQLCLCFTALVTSGVIHLGLQSLLFYSSNKSQFWRWLPSSASEALFIFKNKYPVQVCPKIRCPKHFTLKQIHSQGSTLAKETPGPTTTAILPIQLHLSTGTHLGQTLCHHAKVLCHHKGFARFDMSCSSKMVDSVILIWIQNQKRSCAENPERSLLMTWLQNQQTYGVNLS